MLHEIALPEAPVDEQVLGQEARRDHAAPVVHVAGEVELTHSGVDDRKTCVTGSPGGEEIGIVLPSDIGIFGFERFVHAAGMGD